MRDDGVWSDDERDADADGLNNYIETTGPASPAGGRAYFAKKEPEPWPGLARAPTSARSTSVRSRTSRPTTPTWTATPLLDAEDDQDNDDILNFYEMYDPIASGHRTAARRKNAFNPCAPDRQLAHLPAVRAALIPGTARR